MMTINSRGLELDLVTACGAMNTCWGQETDDALAVRMGDNKDVVKEEKHL